MVPNKALRSAITCVGSSNTPLISRCHDEEVSEVERSSFLVFGRLGREVADERQQGDHDYSRRHDNGYHGRLGYLWRLNDHEHTANLPFFLLV